MTQTSTDQTQRGAWLAPTDTFVRRHIGPSEAEQARMLETLGYQTMEAFVRDVIPDEIRMEGSLSVGPERGEHELLGQFRALAEKNEVWRSCIGMGYVGTVTPPVVLRNVLENPGWYTQYTPYQSEISQGRLEALLNFQTMIADLTGLPLANASLLDEGTACAEAMSMCAQIARKQPRAFFVAQDCHPQTIEVVKTRAESMGIAIEVGDPAQADGGAYCGILVQYPTTDGRVERYETLTRRAHEAGALVVASADLLALTLLRAPGEWGADICVGCAQRFGVPMGLGGPHAAFMATHEKHARKMPGRIVGVSRDASGKPALRLAIQTREQHIKRDRATSNICTAQVLLAIMASMYGVYHGPEGLRDIARRVRAYTRALAWGVERLGHEVLTKEPFDTIRVRLDGAKGGAADAARVRELAEARRINLRYYEDGTVGVTLDETANPELLRDLCACFGCGGEVEIDPEEMLAQTPGAYPEGLARTSPFMTHPVFGSYHSETAMLRYMTELQSRDLSLAHAMIPLGSCTMKLNATSEMIPVTWPEIAHLHPFAPREQWRGYAEMFADLEAWLADITGYDAVSLMPNAGSQGEYAGLMVIRAYHRSRGEGHRDVCLIPESAHGTNPASAIIAGMRVVGVKTRNGRIDFEDLKAKAEQHRENLSAIMVTYPSTAGIFDPNIREICEVVHEHGGQVYLDGANMNAQCGLCRPGDYGADVSHLNLHKTFCIPHGGGGPGMGPIGVRAHLAAFLPTHPVVRPETAGAQAIGPISAAAYGSPSILPISYLYIALMGSAGLRRASEVALLSANYMAERLSGAYDLLCVNDRGRVAHEFILDCRGFEKSADIRIDDIAKRLMDYGFHAPTMSWPVPGTLMVEPTESEPLSELERFCGAMLEIREEIRAIEEGRIDREDNPLKNAPHTIEMVSADEWTHPYSRQVAAFPTPNLRRRKCWPSVARVDNPYGDRNLACTCASVSEVSEG
ncbi:MAG: aminomethyl-transferring glycine dehydrogenase [Phycisphaerales bacterium JB059]